MWRFVSAARMAQIKADARAEGYIKAVREGLAANDAAKDLRSVTRENTHAANTAVQDMKQDIRHVSITKKRRSGYKSGRGSYMDPNLRLFADGSAVEDFIFKNIGKLTQVEMANYITKKMGTHVKGCRVPIKVIDKFIGHVLHRRLVWDVNTNAFVNVYCRERGH